MRGKGGRQGRVRIVYYGLAWVAFGWNRCEEDNVQVTNGGELEGGRVPNSTDVWALDVWI